MAGICGILSTGPAERTDDLLARLVAGGSLRGPRAEPALRCGSFAAAGLSWHAETLAWRAPDASMAVVADARLYGLADLADRLVPHMDSWEGRSPSTGA